MLVDEVKLLDCTLRDGGYYNRWDFPVTLINDYLQAMSALQACFVEIGFRTLDKRGFKGGCAFSTDKFINQLSIPYNLKDNIAIMINGNELLPIDFSQKTGEEIEKYSHHILGRLFAKKSESPVSLVRIACHIYEFEYCLPAVLWLKERGYKVGFNLMQIADQPLGKVTELAKLASQYPIDVLYFADSMGSLRPAGVSSIIEALRKGWKGEIGIHTHDNMGYAIANTLQAINDGATWVDSTVTGMGRGPGNAQTEYLTIELEEKFQHRLDMTKLLQIIREHFKPLQEQYGWGTNPYYYLAGKYGIHPSYVQEMLTDNRYDKTDILAVIDHLKLEGGKKFTLDSIEAARHFYAEKPRGSWKPYDLIKGKDVLIVGSGPSVRIHKEAIENYIKSRQPYVIALNAEHSIAEDLINARAASHPVRLLADCNEYIKLPQPLITPATMLPKDVKLELKDKQLLDFGVEIVLDTFSLQETYCTIPTSLVSAYALAVAASGKAERILLVGFDGYMPGDQRNAEMESILQLYMAAMPNISLISLTNTQYDLPVESVYAF